MVLAKFYLKSGNVITLEDNLDEINIVKTLKYLEAIVDKFRLSTTTREDGPLGYFRYGGTCVVLNRVEAIEINNALYDECNLVCSVEILRDDLNSNKEVSGKYLSLVFNNLPKTVEDYYKGQVCIDID